ncbi:hypothetical protein KAR27_04460 [Weissella diestrammenae]|nr:hypothetical protein [Weissella diestrammenae]
MDKDIVDATETKGDRSEVSTGTEERNTIIDGATALVPLVDGKWNKVKNSLRDINGILRTNHGYHITGGIQAVTPDYQQSSNGWSWQSGKQSNLIVVGYNYQKSIAMYDNLGIAMGLVDVTVALPSLFVGPVAGFVIGLITGKGTSYINSHFLAPDRNAFDKATDRGFGTVLTKNVNTASLYDYFYNDSWQTPQAALSVPDGSDKRTPSNWPGGAAAIKKDFYGGWSCDYTTSGRWVGTNRNPNNNRA